MYKCGILWYIVEGQQLRLCKANDYQSLLFCVCRNKDTLLATRMPSFGRLNEFGLERGEDWSQYIERMEHYFVANDINDAEKKKAILLSACGGATYKLMCDLLAPAKPGEKTFNDLKDAVQTHL